MIPVRRETVRRPVALPYWRGNRPDGVGANHGNKEEKDEMFAQAQMRIDLQIAEYLHESRHVVPTLPIRAEHFAVRLGAPQMITSQDQEKDRGPQARSETAPLIGVTEGYAAAPLDAVKTAPIRLGKQRDDGDEADAGRAAALRPLVDRTVSYRHHAHLSQRRGGAPKGRGDL